MEKWFSFRSDRRVTDLAVIIKGFSLLQANAFHKLNFEFPATLAPLEKVVAVLR